MFSRLLVTFLTFFISITYGQFQPELTTYQINTQNAFKLSDVDLDSDGDIDIVAVQRDRNEFWWHENDGNGTFTKHTIATGSNITDALATGDVDGDGDIDIVSGWHINNTEVSDTTHAQLFINDGNEVFTAIKLDTSTPYSRGAAMVDLDGDGDLDILFGWQGSAGKSFTWWENNGGLTFTRHDVSTSNNLVWDFEVIDFDTDGDLDIIVAGNDVFYYKNDGNQNFIEHFISTNGNYKVAALDYNNDGDMDIFTIHAGIHNSLFGHINNGDNTFTDSTFVFDDQSFFGGPRAVQAVDFDSDGDVELLVTGTKVNLIEIDDLFDSGDDGLFTNTILTEGGPLFSQITDIDGDNDLDIVGSHPYVRWYEQTQIFFPTTRLELKLAVNAWVSDSVSAEATYGHISTWVVSGVTDMNNMFTDKSTFNSDISSWDVSNVTNMEDMFSGATNFNRDLSSWDVSSVTNMSYMFYYAENLNQDLSSWNVSNVVTMDRIFWNAFSFNGDISTWDVSNVTTFVYSFTNTNFNGDVSDWNVSNVTDMAAMFKACPFDGDLSSWDMSSVTSTAGMFSGSSNFNQDISAWDVSNVTIMLNMFGQNDVFNQNLSTWDVSSLTNAFSLFNGASAFNGDITSWDMSNVTNANAMFMGATGFNQDISSWDVSNVTDMQQMFKEATSFNADISSWDVSNVTNMQYMFMEATSFNADISSWDVSNVTNMQFMFRQAETFNQDISGWDVSNVTNMKDMFAIAIVFNQDISIWDVSNVTSFGAIFYRSDALSDDIFCNIQLAWSINEYWTADYSEYCNEPPVAENMNIVIDEDADYSGIFAGSDIDGDSLIYVTVTEPSNGSVVQTIELDSNFTYIPDTNFFGEDLFAYMIYDGRDSSDTAMVSIMVHPVNDAPVVDSDSTVLLAEDGSAEFVMLGSDVDDDDIEYEVVRYPFYGEYDGITYTPFLDYFGYDTLSYVVIDTSGAESELATVSFMIESVDDEPFVDNYLDHVMLVEDFPEPLTFDLDTVFTDIDGPLTYSADLVDSSVVAVEVVESILSFHALPDANGVTELILTASNPTRASVADTIMVSIEAINDAPAIAVGDTSMNEDGHLAIKIHATDVEGDILNYIDVHFEPEVVDGYFFGGDSLMIHSVVENWNGVVQIHMQIGDGEFIEHGQFDLTVLPVNDAPYFVSPVHATVGVGVEFHLPLHPMDVDSEQLVVTLTDGEQNPPWIMLADSMLHGVPDSLGDYPVYVTLTDGEASVLDTFDIHVVNFKPEIISIEDIPNDQGGEVYVRFNRSFLDNGMETNQLYSVFRWDNIEGQQDWVLVQTGAATGEDYYYYQVPTILDSSMYGDGMTQFKVVASMNNGIFSSDSAMGYSVDNIVPMVPTGMLAASIGNYISLEWDPSPDEDFQYYELVRSGTDGDDLVIELVETSYEDFNIDAGIEYSYKIAAYDYNGNFSGYSEPVLVSMLSAQENGLVPVAYALQQNYPNPFNPTTNINYELPNNEFVSIDIYDVMGHRIKSLVSSNQDAGYKSVHWNATNDLGQPVSAGMYIYTIQAGDFRQTLKMVLLK